MSHQNVSELSLPKVINLGEIPFAHFHTMDDAIRPCAFRRYDYWGVNEKSFPWKEHQGRAFEAALVELSDSSIDRFELGKNDNLVPLSDYEYADHTHLVSYHLHLPEDEELPRNVTAAGFVGDVFGEKCILSLKDDGRGGQHLYRDPDSSLGNCWVSVPHRRMLSRFHLRRYFGDHYFLVARPVR